MKKKNPKIPGVQLISEREELEQNWFQNRYQRVKLRRERGIRH